ncbi:MAG: amidase family protein [Pseudomonadota bacterium]
MGSAAHIAAAVGTLSVGNDAAGSVRMPASFGGVFGIKPTFGMVASYPPSSAGILGHTGPMGWGVAETALLLSVIAGPDPRDPFSLPRQPAVTSPDLEAGVSGMRIAYSPSLGIREPHRQVRASTDAAAKAFESLGANVEAVDPDFSGLIEAYDCIRIVNRAAAYHRSGAGARRSEMDELVARVIDQAAAYSTADYVAALAERDRLTVLMREFHETYDVLLTPTMAVLPLPIGTGPGPDDAHWYLIGGEIWSPYTFPFNMTHQPAASIPCGLTEADDTTPAGLPIGLQVVGGMHRDDLVLRACRAYETTRVWSRPACSFRGGAQ